MVLHKDFKMILRYESEEILIEDFLNEEENGDYQLVFNVKKGIWYRIYCNKRRKVEELYINIRFSKSFLEGKFQIGERRLNTETGNWLNQDNVRLTPNESLLLQGFIEERVRQGYDFLSDELKDKYTLEEVGKMILPNYSCN